MQSDKIIIIAEYLICLLGSNGSTEHVFSHIRKIRSKEKPS